MSPKIIILLLWEYARRRCILWVCVYLTIVNLYLCLQSGIGVKLHLLLNMMGLGGQLHALATQCTYWIGGWASKLGQMSHIREVTVNGLDACGLIPDRSRDFTMWKHLRLFFWTFVHRHICKVKLVFQKLFVLIPSFLLEDRSRTQYLKWWTKSKRTFFCSLLPCLDWGSPNFIFTEYWRCFPRTLKASEYEADYICLFLRPRKYKSLPSYF